MKKEKYYYSKNYRRVLLDAILDDNGIIKSINNKYNVDSLPRVTICGVYDNEQNTMTYGIARCSSRDNFVRRIGQKISYNRAFKNPYKIVQINPTDKISEVFITNAKLIEEEVLGKQITKFNE